MFNIEYNTLTLILSQNRLIVYLCLFTLCPHFWGKVHQGYTWINIPMWWYIRNLCQGTARVSGPVQDIDGFGSNLAWTTIIISRSAVPNSYNYRDWAVAACIHTSDRNKAWVRYLYHSTAPVKMAKSLAHFDVIRHGEVLYQKPQLEFMLHGIYMYMYVHVPVYSIMY